MSSRRFGRRAWTLRPLLEAKPWRAAGRFDVIVAGYGTLGWMLDEYRSLGLVSGPLVTFFRGHDAGRIPRQHPGCYQRLMQRGQLFLTVSQDLRRRILELGAPPDSVLLLRGGIKLADFVPCPPPSLVPDTSLRVISVGRLVAMKGFSDALAAMSPLADRGIKVRYQIVGDGPLRGALEKQAAGLPAGIDVEFRGWQEAVEVRRMISKSHVLLAPSRTPENGDCEGIPNVIKEAFALGRAVVSTRHAGIPEIVRDGVSGRLVGEGEPASLADALAQLHANPEALRTMGAAGRLTVEADYDLSKLNDRLASLLQTVAEDWRRRGGLA